jgi:type I restriction enzyme S subunit
MTWPSVPLGDVAPAQPSSIQFQDDFPIWHLTLDQIESGSGNIINKRIAPPSQSGSSSYIFDENNVLYSKLRPYLNKVVKPNECGIATTELVPLRPNSGLLDRSFLTYYLRSREFVAFATQSVAGVKMPRLMMDKFWKHRIPIPPLSEQRRIVAILDQADALRKKRAEADKATERILPALFYKMFGDPLKLTQSPNAKPLDEHAVEIQNGFACGDKNVPGGSPHLRMNNIDDRGTLNLDLVRTVPKEYDKYNYRLQDGDVLFMATNSQEKVGKACVFYQPDDETYLFSNHLVRLRILDKSLTPEFLASYLHLLWTKKYFQSIAKRWVNQATVSIHALKNIKIPVADRDTMVGYSSSFRTALTLVKKQQAATAELQKLFDVMSHKAFSGTLTAEWREAHMKELLQEIKEQARELRKASV